MKFTLHKHQCLGIVVLFCTTIIIIVIIIIIIAVMPIIIFFLLTVLVIVIPRVGSGALSHVYDTFQDVNEGSNSFFVSNEKGTLLKFVT